MTPRQMSIKLEEEGRRIAGLQVDLQAALEMAAGLREQNMHLTQELITARGTANAYARDIEAKDLLIRELHADRERFEWFFTDDRVSTDALVELQLRHINREKTTVDEWRNAIDQARDQ